MSAATSMATRAGRYVTQTEGYRAFIPAPLPPEPPIDIGGRLQELLSGADYALGRLDGAILTLPSPDVFVFMYVRKEAVLSSLSGVAEVSREAAQTAAAILRVRED